MDEETREPGRSELVEGDSGLTLNQKYIKFHKNQYSFPPPPVPTEYWNAGEWVEFIDKYGVWHE